MKLATIHDGTRDGRLAVVTGDLTRAAYADGIAGTMQGALDDWQALSPKLVDNILTDYAALLPMVRWLNGALGHGSASRR